MKGRGVAGLPNQSRLRGTELETALLTIGEYTLPADSNALLAGYGDQSQPGLMRNGPNRRLGRSRTDSLFIDAVVVSSPSSRRPAQLGMRLEQFADLFAFHPFTI